MTRQENRQGADWLREQMEQGGADEADAGQLWKEKQAGEEYRNTGGTHRANRQPKPRKHNETRQDCDRTMTMLWKQTLQPQLKDRHCGRRGLATSTGVR